MGETDVLAIADVLHAYCEGIDEARLDDVAALFTADCRFDRGFGTVYEGRDAVRDFLAESIGGYAASSHHLSNLRVHADGPVAARARSYVHAYLRYADSDEAGQLWARYRDRLVRVEGRWLIAERAIRAAGWEGVRSRSGGPPFERVARTGERRYNI